MFVKICHLRHSSGFIATESLPLSDGRNTTSVASLISFIIFDCSFVQFLSGGVVFLHTTSLSSDRLPLWVFYSTLRSAAIVEVTGILTGVGTNFNSILRTFCCEVVRNQTN